jgi:hypothetical protein
MIKRMGMSGNVEYVALNDCSKEEMRSVFDRVAKQSNIPATEDEFNRLFDTFGGRVKEWRKLAKFSGGDKERELIFSKFEADSLVQQASIGQLSDVIAPTETLNSWKPETARAVFRTLVQAGDGGASHRHELFSIGHGNGLSSCGPGVAMSTILALKGVERAEIAAMVRARILAYNPSTDCVTCASRYIYHEIRDNAQLWSDTKKKN